MQGFISGASLTTFYIKMTNSVVQLYFGHQVNYSYSSLDLQLAYAKHVVYHLVAYNSNQSQCSNSMFIRIITFHNTITTMLGLAKFLTVRERRRFESISTSQEFISNTNPHFPHRGHVGSPLVQLRSTFRGFAQRRTIRDTKCLDVQAQPALGLSLAYLHILTTIQSVHSYRAGPGLS